MKRAILLAALALAACSPGPPPDARALRYCGNIYATAYVQPNGARWMQMAGGDTEPVAPEAKLDEICTVPK